jgi:hypothetical protein
MRSEFLEKIYSKNLCIAALRNYFLKRFSQKWTSRLDYFISVFGIIRFLITIHYFIIVSEILNQV